MELKPDIAVGVPMFQREQALKQFLNSVPTYVTTAYIADNGHTKEHAHIYENEYAFDIQVIELDYDSGIGACRNAIAESVSEPHLWIGDNDMQFVDESDLWRLYEILDHWPELGGVSGFLVEGNEIRSGATDLNKINDTLIKSTNTKQIINEPYPHAIVDMPPQAGLFRTEIFDTYTFDATLTNTEHADFFYGHKQEGVWKFASTPSVLIKHNKMIDADYRENQRSSKTNDMDIFEDKWGVSHITIGEQTDWITTRNRTDFEFLFDILRRFAPPSIWIPIRRIAKRVVA